jgi:membrane-bound serine protease (ClpP class)
VAEIENSINPSTLNYLDSVFKESSTTSNSAIVIKLNTPGGLVSTTKKIISLIGESSAPVIIWITPQGASATSAGAIIASSAHILFMSEATNIGAATPVEMGKDIKQEDMRAKAINDLVALVKSQAQARGKNPDGFALMVEKGKSYTSAQATKENLIDGIVNNQNDLLTTLNGKEVKVKGQSLKLSVNNPTLIFKQMDLGQRLLDIFANPSLAYLLFIIGAALIYLELQAPGGFIAGSVGGLLLILAGISFQVLPLNFGAFGLLIASFVFFILEVYITSYGILALIGLGSLISGSLFLFRTDDAYLHFSSNVVIGTVAGISSFIGIVAYLMLKDLRSNRVNDFNRLESKEAHVVEVIDEGAQDIYHYRIKVNGEIWKATSNKAFQVGDMTTVKKQCLEQMICEI